MIEKPYLLFLGDAPDQLAAKVAQGIADWRPDDCVGQISLDGCKADVGLKEMSIADAVKAGAKTLVVGVANRGGVISDVWTAKLIEAMEAGLDLASGLHNLLSDVPELAKTAAATGRSMHDVRTPPIQYPIATGKRRTGKRLLAVGTDCSVGKMYTALAFDKEMKDRGLKSTFRATGQTGILITGDGVPLDAVVADFMAGSIEHLTPDNDPDHWDIIEGQGSLLHASFSGVTMALVHGGQPDALVICHEPTRDHMRGLPDYELPKIGQIRDLALELAQWVNPGCKVVGICVNTSSMNEGDAHTYLEELSKEYDLPAVDPFRGGVGQIVDRL